LTARYYSQNQHMAKSKETFNKKEKEKKKLKKRQDKQEKKEERQSAARNGNNLEEMMAYIDENGNISSTPPDPKRKIVIKAEDIQIGVTKQEPEEEGDLIRSGVVTMFNEQKGYGFIKDLQSQESVFVHINSLETRIRENDKVTFEVEMGHKGKNAVNVKKT
jgi:cold shock CspA family protein